MRTQILLAMLLALPVAACDDCGGGADTTGAPSGKPGPASGEVRARTRRFPVVALDAGADAFVTDAAPGVAADAGAQAPLRGRPKTELVTTPGVEALAALDRAINAPPPRDALGSVALAEAKAVRARVRGDLEEVLGALSAVDAAIALDARLATPHAARARLLVTLRRWGDAKVAATRAKELGADVSLVLADLDWNAGAYAAAADAVRRVSLAAPSAEGALRRARLEHEMGNDAEAERAFERAEDLTVDASPFPVAEIDIARGFARLDAGKVDEARVFFEDALSRVPSHVVAARGLALAGKPSLSLAEGARDPELLASFADATKSAPLRARAKARFEELLVKLPEATRLAAAAFFVDADPKRAATLAAKDAEASPTAATFTVLARASLAAGDLVVARAAIDSALRAPAASARTDWTAARVYGRQGDSGKSAELASRARRKNPHVESEEPPLPPATPAPTTPARALSSSRVEGD